MCNSDINSGIHVSDYSCNFEISDGVGHKATAKACVDACVIEKETDSDFNGVTIISCGTGNCHYQRNMNLT